jgi:hypothetical protein
MASIPLPALAVNTQQESPLKLYAEAQRIKSAQTQQQTAQLQQTGLEQENQQRALQLQDQMTLRSLAPNHVTKDADGNVTGFDQQGLIKEAAAKGVSPQTLNLMQNQYAESVKNLAGANEAVRNNEAAKNKSAYEVLEGLRSEPDVTKRAYILQSSLPNLQKLGVDTTKLAQPNLPLDDKSLDSFEAGLGMHSQMLADAKTFAETAASQAKVKEADLQAKEFAAKLPGGALQPVDQKELTDWLSKNPGKGPADYEVAMKKIVPAYNFNLQNQGATGSAGKPGVIAQSLANGTMKWQDVVSNRTPLAVKQQLLEETKALNPNFNSGDFSIEQSVRKEFTSGDAAKNLTAFNTAIEHSKQLSIATDALDNGDVRTLNKIGNAFGYEFGSDKQTNFNVIKNALSGEISKVFKGGQATDAEIKAVQQPFDAANSTTQLKGAINNAIALMNSKRDALKQQYEQGTQGKPNFNNVSGNEGNKILSPSDWLAQKKKQ